MIWLLCGAIVLIAIMASVSLGSAGYLRAYRSASTALFGSDESRLRPTTVVIPCKGDDGSLLHNLGAVIRQIHPDIEYCLVAATATDPAQAVFARLKELHPACRIKTVVAGIPAACSQQNNNQVKGIDAADPRSEVFVIMDSDGQCDPRFIAKLTAPLSDPAVGGTTGYRWYEPRWHSLPDLLRTAWNAGGYAFLVHPRTSFVWGGAMAFRRADYERARIAELWSRTLDDDMTLSNSIRALKMKFHFVPECIVISRNADTLRSAVHWTNRQTLITRFYNRPFWIMAGLFHVVGNLLGWGLLVGGLLHLLVRGADATAWIALAGGTLWIGHLWVYGLLLLDPLDSFLRPRGIVLGARKLLLVFIGPLASLLQGLNSLNSLTTRKITWAGITYHIESYERMRVV